MSKNLKVNSKTSVLEWKRKFNNLVESSPVKIETSNIESLSDADLNSLQCGDVVKKKTGNQFHCYIVTYKEENHGICMSYFDAGYTETISYDYTNGHWVFNSKDVVETQEKLVSGTNIKTIGGQSILGSGNLNISGGTKLYNHSVTCESSGGTNVYSLILITSFNTPLTIYNFESLVGNDGFFNSSIIRPEIIRVVSGEGDAILCVGFYEGSLYAMTLSNAGVVSSYSVITSTTIETIRDIVTEL